MIRAAHPRLLRTLAPGVLVAAAAAGVAGCGGGAADADDARPVAVATAPQIDSLLQELAGNGVRVETIVPPTADLHEVELRPSQVRSLREAKLILRPGRENDAWAAEALAQVKGEQVDAAQGVPGDARHWWMDPTFAATSAATIAAALDRIDPAGKGARATALARVTDELTSIDRETKTCLATIPASRRSIVTDHDAAGAYADRYGLKVVGTISPGADPEAAPSAQRVADLEALMQRTRVAALFPIAPHGSALAKTIAERGGATLGDPLWADALPGATHDHGDDGDHGDEGAGHDEHAGGETAPTLQSAARLNAASVAKALKADRSACTPFLS